MAQTQQEKIQQMYDELYKSKYDQLLKDKENKLNGLNSQGTSINNNYTNTKSELDRQREDITNRYNQKYQELDSEKAKGKEKYYGDRNNAAYGHAKNTQATRDYMAKQNLLQSGESVDAMLRGNTDFNNNLGQIYGAEQNFNKGIEDTRGKYGSEQSNYYGQLDNTLNSALSERDRLLAGLEAERNSINNGFDGSVGALQSEIKSQAMKDIMAYQEQLRQEAWQKQMEEERRKWEAEQRDKEWQRQQANRSYSSGGGGGYSSGGSGKYTETQAKADLDNEIGYALGTGDPSTIATARDRLNAAYQQGLITDSYYNGKLSGLNASYTSSSKANDKIAQGNYGYSQTPRPNAKPYRPGKNTVQRW